MNDGLPRGAGDDRAAWPEQEDQNEYANGAEDYYLRHPDRVSNTATGTRFFVGRNSGG